MSSRTLPKTPRMIQWAVLVAASVVFIAAFELMRLPAALMLGAIAAAILLSWFEGRVTDSALGLCYRSGFRRLPRRARHHARNRGDDFS